MDSNPAPVPVERTRYGSASPTQIAAKTRPAELDGIIAHIYGLTEDEFAYVLGAFPLVAAPVKEAALAAYRAVEGGALA